MRSKIYTKNNKLIIEIPLQAQRTNPYNPDYKAPMKNICALITKDKFGNGQMGFCKYIDMEYKGKMDQFTDFFYKWWGDKDEFEEICKKLKIDIIYYGNYGTNYTTESGKKTLKKQ